MSSATPNSANNASPNSNKTPQSGHNNSNNSIYNGGHYHHPFQLSGPGSHYYDSYSPLNLGGYPSPAFPPPLPISSPLVMPMNMSSPSVSSSSTSSSLSSSTVSSNSNTPALCPREAFESSPSVGGSGCDPSKSPCQLCLKGSPSCLNSKSSWATILWVVFFSLKEQNKQQEFFSLKRDVYNYVSCHWNILCPKKHRSHKWKKQIQDALSHSKVFKNGIQKLGCNGYWKLKAMTNPWTTSKPDELEDFTTENGGSDDNLDMITTSVTNGNGKRSPSYEEEDSDDELGTSATTTSSTTTPSTSSKKLKIDMSAIAQKENDMEAPATPRANTSPSNVPTNPLLSPSSSSSNPNSINNDNKDKEGQNSPPSSKAFSIPSSKIPTPNLGYQNPYSPKNPSNLSPLQRTMMGQQQFQQQQQQQQYFQQQQQNSHIKHLYDSVKSLSERLDRMESKMAKDITEYKENTNQQFSQIMKYLQEERSHHSQPTTPHAQNTPLQHYPMTQQYPFGTMPHGNPHNYYQQFYEQQFQFMAHQQQLLQQQLLQHQQQSNQSQALSTQSTSSSSPLVNNTQSQISNQNNINNPTNTLNTSSPSTPSPPATPVISLLPSTRSKSITNPESTLIQTTPSLLTSTATTNLQPDSKKHEIPERLASFKPLNPIPFKDLDTSSSSDRQDTIKLHQKFLLNTSPELTAMSSSKAISDILNEPPPPPPKQHK